MHIKLQIQICCVFLATYGCLNTRLVQSLIPETFFFVQCTFDFKKLGEEIVERCDTKYNIECPNFEMYLFKHQNISSVD